jgi:hypothetical protein
MSKKSHRTFGRLQKAIQTFWGENDIGSRAARSI